MVEVAVMMAITVLVAGIILASFPALSGSIKLQRSSRDVALALRRAQNFAFAVREVALDDGTRTVPGAYGLYFNRQSAPGSYLIFADLRGVGGDPNGRYDEGSDPVIERASLDTGLAFEDFVTDFDSPPQALSRPVVNVTFSIPESRLTIRNLVGAVAGESVELRLADSRGSLRRSVYVRSTGQIYTR